MATLPAAGYISNAARSEGEAKVALDDLIASIKQIPGAGVAETTLTIASGSITPPSGGPGIFKVDTEASAATDDLTNIVQTNIPDGSIVLIRIANSARVTVVKHNAGGAGQITLRSQADTTLSTVAQWMALKRSGSLWEEVFRSGNEYLESGLVSADPTVALGVASKQYADQHGFTTGDVKPTLKTTADTTWVMMDDKTIGDASSGATGRANADTAALFTLLWTNIIDAWAPVSGGRGGSAAADYAAHKTIALPKTLGRSLAIGGTGTSVASGTNADVDTTGDTLTVLTNNTKWVTGMPAVFTLASGTITGLTSGTTYYVVRNSATLIKLASSLVNAQNGTVIDFTAKSSPVWSLTYSTAARVLGEHGGEDAHAMSSVELLGHGHTGTFVIGAGGAALAAGSGYGNFGSVSATGSNVAMNIVQPETFMNVMVKL